MVLFVKLLFIGEVVPDTVPLTLAVLSLDHAKVVPKTEEENVISTGKPEQICTSLLVTDTTGVSFTVIGEVPITSGQPGAETVLVTV